MSRSQLTSEVQILAEYNFVIFEDRNMQFVSKCVKSDFLLQKNIYISCYMIKNCVILHNMQFRDFKRSYLTHYARYDLKIFTDVR